MKNKWILIVIALVLALMAISYDYGRIAGRKASQGTIEERVDTLFICDTIMVTEPVSVTRRVVDSILVPVTDTMSVHDTLMISLPEEQVCWKDTNSTIYVSGYRPRVDSVFHYNTTQVITKTCEVTKYKRTRWGLGMQGGMGCTSTGVIAPYLGIGISYNFLSW